MHRGKRIINGSNSLIGSILKIFSFWPRNNRQTRKYTTDILFDENKVVEKMDVTGSFNKEVIIRNRLEVDKNFMAELEKAFYHPSVFDYREIEGGKLIVTTFQITHDRGPIRFIDGRRIEALDLGVGKDGKNTYICKEGKRFIIDKSEFDTVMKDGIDVLSRDKIILTKEQLNIIRANMDELRVDNISESKIEELEGNEFEKDLEPIYIKFAKMYDIKVKNWIDRD